MSAKKGKKRIETRTLLYILLVIIIVGAVYLFIAAQEETPKYYDPEYILRNSDSFIGQSIIVEGYYDAVTEGGSIVSEYQDIGSGEPAAGLKLDYSNITNVSTKLIEDVQLHFIGHLEYINPEYEFSGVILIATEITDSW